jgi:hypothetical protein
LDFSFFLISQLVNELLVMNQDTLESLSRKDLQQLAKEHGLKANKKSVDLVQELLVIFSTTATTAVKEEEKENEIICEIETNSLPTEVILPSNQAALNVAPLLPTLVFSGDKSDLKVSDEISFDQNLKLINGKIKRLNKLSVRVVLEDGSELTIPYSDIRGFSIPADNEIILPVVNEKNEESVSTEHHLENSVPVESMDQVNEEVNHYHIIIDTIEEGNDESTICDVGQSEEIQEVNVSQVRDAQEADVSEDEADCDIDAAESEDEEDQISVSEPDEDATAEADQHEEQEDDEEAPETETDQSFSTPAPQLITATEPEPEEASEENDKDLETEQMNVCDEEDDLKVTALFVYVSSSPLLSCVYR